MKSESERRNKDNGKYNVWEKKSSSARAGRARAVS